MKHAFPTPRSSDLQAIGFDDGCGVSRQRLCAAVITVSSARKDGFTQACVCGKPSCFPAHAGGRARAGPAPVVYPDQGICRDRCNRSEEHTSELPSLMRNSYAVFCLTKKTTS